jgi:hypothetical protein
MTPLPCHVCLLESTSVVKLTAKLLLGILLPAALRLLHHVGGDSADILEELPREFDIPGLFSAVLQVIFRLDVNSGQVATKR